MMKRLLLLLAILALAPCGQSMVNMRNASYAEKWVDYIDPEAGIEIKIERFYSSRSLFIGMFGYGWCSRFETHLTITSDGILNLTECGGGLEVTYYPNNFDAKNRDYTIDKIVEDFKSKRKMTITDIANLKAQLKLNNKMRFEYAKQLGEIDDKKIKMPGNTFFSRSKGFEKIVFDGNFYTRKMFNGGSETYNKQGKLVNIKEPTGEELRLSYKGQNLVSIKDNSRSLTFSYSGGSGKTVTKITNGRGLSVSYKYQGDNLEEVTNMWSKTYRFRYDANHNMTRVDFPDNTFIKMDYDLSNDWIKRYTNRDKCVEDYDFHSVGNNNKDNYYGTFTRTCDNGKTVAKGRHEFWYQTYPNAPGKYLQRVLEEYRAESKDVYFHPHFGRPVKITEDNIYFRGFSYYDNGFVNTREDVTYRNIAGRRGPVTAWTKAKYEYDRKTFRIDELDIKTLDSKGKQIGSRNIKVSYNKHGMLSKATEGKSKFISIEYDKSGKVSQMSNETGDVVLLTHQVGVDKPVEIEYKKVGKVKITYDNDGQVVSLDTGEKRNIATSIIEKFLEMVTFLGPLGEEMQI